MGSYQRKSVDEWESLLREQEASELLASVFPFLGFSAKGQEHSATLLQFYRRRGAMPDHHWPIFKPAYDDCYWSH